MLPIQEFGNTILLHRRFHRWQKMRTWTHSHGVDNRLDRSGLADSPLAYKFWPMESLTMFLGQNMCLDMYCSHKIRRMLRPQEPVQARSGNCSFDLTEFEDVQSLSSPNRWLNGKSGTMRL